MKFNDFIEINGFAASSHREFMDAMKEFIMSPRLKPFTQAVMARASDANKKEFEALLKAYWESLNQATVLQTADYWNKILTAPKNIADYSPTKIEEFKTKFAEENGRVAESDQEAFDYCMTKILKEFTESSKIMRKMLYPQATRDPYSIQRERDITDRFIQIGVEILIEEINRAITLSSNALQQTNHLVDFHEFCNFAWKGNRSDYFEPSIYHFLGYLSFIQAIVLQFNSNLLANESVKKAKEFQQLFEMIRAKLVKSHSDYGELMLKIADCEAILGLSDRISHLVPPKHAPEGHANIDGCLERERAEHAEISGEHFAALRALEPLDVELDSYAISFDEAGRFNTQHQDIMAIFDNINYWLAEIPRVIARGLQVTGLMDFILSGKTTDKLYRQITQAELEDIKQHKEFRQGGGSFEREKWFYYSKGQPSVDHPYICVIHVNSGLIGLLKSIAQPAGNHAAVTAKEAEPDCIGIHEDCLSYLNRNIQSVDIYQNTVSPANKRETIRCAATSEPINLLNQEISAGEILHPLQDLFQTTLSANICPRSVLSPIVSQVAEFHGNMTATNDYYRYLGENIQQLLAVTENANVLAGSINPSVHFDVVLNSLAALIRIIQEEILIEESDETNDPESIPQLAM